MVEERRRPAADEALSAPPAASRERADAPRTEGFRLTGRPELEAFFNENVVDVVDNLEQYRRMGIGFPGGIVLWGEPGCGKTYAIEKLVEYLGWPCYTVDAGSIASPYIHETSKRIAALFDEAVQHAPAVVVIDEMDAFLSSREADSLSGIHHTEEISEFLRRIPEMAAKRVLVVAMTNRIDKIDPAILRHGRFDHIVEVKMASAEEICTLLSSMLKELPCAAGIDLEALSRRLAGRPLSAVTFVVRQAGRIAVRKNKGEIDQGCFEEALLLLDTPEAKRRKIGFSD